MKTHEIPPVEVLRRYFRIDAHWRLERKTAAHGWRLAAKKRGANDYFTLSFEGKTFLAHRIIWTLHHGVAPTGLIDHINGQKWDNRIENLREATHTQNRWNAHIRKSNSTGEDSVVRTAGGFRAKVVADYQPYYSPVFDDAELAGLAAIAMKERLYGEFAHARRAA
jgi:hypothetical protein